MRSEGRTDDTSHVGRVHVVQEAERSEVLTEFLRSLHTGACCRLQNGGTDFGLSEMFSRSRFEPLR